MNMFAQLRPFAWRSVLRAIRRPHLYLPAFFMAVIGLVVNTAMIGSADRLPGFPAENFVSFSLATGIVMGSLFSPLLVGSDIAADMNNGFLSRVSLTPVRRWIILLGSLVGVGLMGLLLGGATLLVGLLLGSTFEAGWPGLLVLLVQTAMITMAFGSLGALIALKTGNAEAVAGAFALSFALVFFSTGTMPRELILADWFRTVADLNPMSHLIAGVRSLIVTGWEPLALLGSFGSAFLILVVGLIFGVRALNARLN